MNQTSKLLFFIILIAFTSCKTTPYYSFKRGYNLASIHGYPYDPPYRKSYRPTVWNWDDTENVILIDSLFLDLDSCVFVRSKKSLVFYLFTDIPSEKKMGKEKNFMSNPNCYVTQACRSYQIPLEEMRKRYKMDVEFPAKKKTEESKDFWFCEFKNKPKCFLLFLIRGNVYLFLTTGIMDGINFGPLPFNDSKAYYKILVPVWEQKISDEI